MKKIPSLFQRNYDGDRLVRDELVPGSEWVAAGEGIPTPKWDGTACMIREGKLYRRFDAKKGKATPDSFEPAELEPDPVTGHWPGWVPVRAGEPGDRWHLEALEGALRVDGTYELIGPKVQGNPHGAQRHTLVRHGVGAWPPGDRDEPPRDFVGLRAWFERLPIFEGIVWHTEDGRMVKIKRKDFGLKWPAK